MTKVNKLLKLLEDPRYPSLGPHLRLLSLIGMWHPNLKSTLSRIKLAFHYIVISFFVSQYINSLIKFDIDSLKLLLQYAPFHIGVVKTCFFQKDHTKWERLVKFISEEELNQISVKDTKQDGIINDYIHKSRRVTYFFWAVVVNFNFVIFSEPYLKNQFIENGTSVYSYMFDGYTPFERDPPGYYYSMFVQTVLGNCMSACIVVWDMLVVSIMIFFAGQLRMCKLYCKRVVDLQSPENTHRNIARCHQLYISLLQYQKEFNELISPVMFVYLVVVCVNIGVCIIEIAEIGDIATVVSGCLYILAILIQLLLLYWHANEVIVESQLVRYSTFKSDWTYADKKAQKEIALLSLTMTKRLMFTAGPYNEMSLATFLSILRMSYSFYTLLKGTN